MSDSQFGFRPKRCTLNAVVNFVNECIHGVDYKNFVVGKFCDMSNVFDTVNHKILLEKLRYYGISDLSLNFLKSYLSDRYQMVDYNGSHSQYLPVTAGVPQGSILGPVLFIIYVSDLPVSINNNLISSYMYADDLAIILNRKNASLSNVYLASVDSTIDDWSSANFLCLNQDKTQVINFSAKP